MYDPFPYWEERSKAWIKSKFNTKGDWEAIKEFIDPNWRVLELGCGTGRWAKKFKDYVGVDISPTLVVHAKEKNPTKEFYHHDMRSGVKLPGFDLIFTYTAWLHVPPEEIIKVELPDTNYLFVEPHKESRVSYCFNHDYHKLFGVNELAKHGDLTIWGKFI